MTTRQSHRAPLRRRPYVLKTVEALSSTDADRQSVLTPGQGVSGALDQNPGNPDSFRRPPPV